MNQSSSSGGGGGSNDSILKSNEPSKSRFKQQKLGAWQPIITAKTVLPAFIIIGILFTGLGVGLLHFSNKVQEIKLDYTNCPSIGNESVRCSEEVVSWEERLVAVAAGGKRPSICYCDVEFRVDKKFEGDVYMYYALTNFYQNHRTYVRSRDDGQLLGKPGDMNRDPSKDCDPYDTLKVGNETKRVWPCGVIANSMFQDTIELHVGVKPELLTPVPMLRTGIAWESDKKWKFKNPDGWDKESFASSGFVQPPAWLQGPFDLDPENPDNNGVQNEDFIVWMRTAALPDFRKLYQRLDRSHQEYREGLPPGNYTFKIQYSYPVIQFKGTKSIILSTTSLLGAKNPFLGIAFISLGGICLALGILFIFVHLKYGKSRWEITHLD